MSDFQISDHGTIVLIRPMSEEARAWVEENVASDPWQWLGGALAVEHRYAGDLIDGIAAEGFSIEGGF